MKKANAIIPTKSNFDDLYSLIGNLQRDEAVDQIVVIADGSNAYGILSQTLPEEVVLLFVPLASGIHKMWNMGMDYLKGSGLHLAIVNDDVHLTENAMSTICDLLERRPEIGLVNPSPNQNETEEFIGSEGFGGFCMVLAADLVDEWRFDERMMWWYGDNDVIVWTSRVKKRLTGYTGLCHGLNNRSATIVNDPPPNFHADINNDAKLFQEKWG